MSYLASIFREFQRSTDRQVPGLTLEEIKYTTRREEEFERRSKMSQNNIAKGRVAGIADPDAALDVTIKKKALNV